MVKFSQNKNNIVTVFERSISIIFIMMKSNIVDDNDGWTDDWSIFEVISHMMIYIF